MVKASSWILSSLLVSVTLLQGTAIFAEKGSRSSKDVCFTRQELTARSSGFLEKIYVREGDEVKQGAKIAELDSRILKAAQKEARAGVAVAKANVSLAKDTLERLRTLSKTDTVSPQEMFGATIKVDQAAAGYEQAKAVLERITAQLEDTRFVAKINGKVSGLPQVKGLYVQAGNSLGRIEAPATACTAASASNH
jgi:RND family efflux transporter MFP subunit